MAEGFITLVSTKTFMRKSILLIVLFFCAGKLMAQKATIAPFDNTLNNKLTPTFKVDSTWRVAPPVISADNFLKQENIDLSKIKLENQQPLLIAAEGYKMPILNLNNTSKMPVIVLDGNSKMPIVGKDMTKAKRATLATPIP